MVYDFFRNVSIKGIKSPNSKPCQNVSLLRHFMLFIHSFIYFISSICWLSIYQFMSQIVLESQVMECSMESFMHKDYRN